MKQFGDTSPVGPWRSLKRAAKPFVRQAIYAVNRRLGRFENRVWLIGEGRSGTTWLGDLINADERMLQRFEPFQPDYNPRVQQYPKLLYRRPGTRDEALETMLRQTFRVEYWDRWVDQHQRGWIYDGVLVKDIYASLLAKWALETLPPIKPILLIRNPFTVASSKISKTGWEWADSLSTFLADEALVEDHLAEFVPLLRRISALESPFFTHIAVWAIVHHVLLRQFSRAEIHVVFHEDAIVDHEGVIAELNRYLGRRAAGSDMAAGWNVTKHSRVSSAEGVASTRKDPYGRWKVGLDAESLAEGMKILQAFRLDQVYDEHGRPDAARLPFKRDLP